MDKIGNIQGLTNMLREMLSEMLRRMLRRMFRGEFPFTGEIGGTKIAFQFFGSEEQIRVRGGDITRE